MGVVSRLDAGLTAEGQSGGSVAVVRAGGVAAVLAGLVMGVHEWWDDRVPGIQQGLVPSALHATWIGLMFVGMLGLSALQWPSFGRFGRFASAVVVVGTAGMFVPSLTEALSVAVSGPGREGDPPLPVLVVLFAAFGCYVAGLLLFSVATIRARVLPRAAGVFLLVSILLKMFASGVVPGTLALMGAAFAVLGLAALRTARPRDVAA